MSDGIHAEETIVDDYLGDDAPLLTEDAPLLADGETADKPSDDDLPRIGNDPVPPGKASLFSSIFNLSNTIMGAGTLSIPFAISSAGLIGGIALIIFVASLSYTAFTILIKCGEATRQYSYKGIARIAFGKYFAVFAEFILVLYTTGTLISYPIILGDFVSDIFRAFIPEHFGIIYTVLCNPPGIIIIISTFLLLPLCALPRIDFLRFTSMIAIFNIFVTIFVVTVHLFYDIHAIGFSGIADRGAIRLVNPSLNFFLALPLLGVSFTAHYNVFNIYAELKGRSEKKSQVVILPSVLVCIVSYLAMGLSGYLSFRQEAQDDILNSYSMRDLAAIVGRLAMAFTIAFSYPLVCFAWRRNICNVFLSWTKDTYLRHISVTLVAIVGSSFLAIAVNKISIVLGISGSVAGTCVVYIFPALFYLRLRMMGIVGKKDPTWLTIIFVVACVTLLVAGTIFGVGGFISSMRALYVYLKSMVDGFHHKH
ncbi:Amino acid transporter transmembrane [Carpediemonas membranifera]|uniref:Amino acid transporter transmembrane n=1 Tax=Carpediemonas membranifera TaxID=201153 RepID=A0A8J6B0E7_9EUKA|nr:Amino acid transporter transmembrane [Carpediemonas membranifera]|eukprot:KAG9390254.1 Amino acid transporter transmembrane [Carpediemonas membranifera]